MRRELTEWENIFANDTSEKGSISRIYKELTPLNTERQTIQFKNFSKGKTLLQGGHTDGPQTYEKMLNITSHQRDAN